MRQATTALNSPYCSCCCCLEGPLPRRTDVRPVKASLLMTRFWLLPLAAAGPAVTKHFPSQGDK